VVFIPTNPLQSLICLAKENRFWFLQYRESVPFLQHPPLQVDKRQRITQDLRGRRQPLTHHNLEGSFDTVGTRIRSGVWSVDCFKGILNGWGKQLSKFTGIIFKKKKKKPNKTKKPTLRITTAIYGQSVNLKIRNIYSM